MLYINEKLQSGEIILSVFSENELEWVMDKLDSVIDKDDELDFNTHDDWGNRTNYSINLTINEIIDMFQGANTIPDGASHIISDIINTFEDDLNVFNLYELVEDSIERFIENVQGEEEDF